MSATPAIRDQRLRRWEQHTGGWLIALAMVYLAAYAVPILAPGLPGTWRHTAATVTFAIWALLAVEFVLRLALAGSRWSFLKVRLFDLATLVLPPLRPLRLVTIIFMVVRRNASTLGRVRVRLGTYVAACTALLLFLSSLTILDVERRNPDATITTFGDALWWSITTVTTVGYGDLYPTTTEGRLIAIALMVGGIALAGLVTATLASWFMDRFSELRATEAQTTSEVAVLTEEVRRLRDELHAQRHPGPADGPGTGSADGVPELCACSLSTRPVPSPSRREEDADAVRRPRSPGEPSAEGTAGGSPRT
ncbi:potassium channel family protein [Streptomyces sp. MUM 136J]|uniref:potassium channel family protein n=1 Tax=Streptomyces sp. MUM 136J TaxID=2791992 RepID=UPI001F046290|nr:potassium channel family protein [Streptomyces sp. MUM 136J]MCH0573066.1 potassium channel family protein [Streptomyces sp. MUM 136J]